MARKKSEDFFQQKVNHVLKYISGAEPEVREKVARDLPAHNKLLTLHALSFKEMALKPFAIEQGFDITDVLFDYKDVKPACTRCGEPKRIKKADGNSYTCNACKRKFTPNDNSISSNSKADALQWMKLLYCLIEGLTVEKSCEYAEISNNTYYKLRNRIFYAMELMMEEVKLYGLIQIDNMKEKLSLKGTSLFPELYPEDSPFDNPRFIPREARKRGGPYKRKEMDINTPVIFAAIDNYGHSMTRYVGLGNVTTSRLHTFISSSKFLQEVPEKDPFPLMRRGIKKADYDLLRSKMVSDGEAALIKFAKSLDMDHEHHVFRQGGVQRKLSPDANDIQRVNSLHSRLSRFLQTRHSVATKYLPGFLTLFEFIENTGATDAAIERLFEIIAKPGLGKEAGFYEHRYKTPNYILEWQEDNALFRKFTPVQLMAIYLNHKRKLAEKDKSIPPITMAQILEETGIATEDTVRLHYNNALASGVLEEIYERMDTEQKYKYKLLPPPTEKKSGGSRTRYSDFAFIVYDEYVKMLKGPYEDRISYEALLRLLSEKHGVFMPRQTVFRQMKYIEQDGLRKDLLSELKAQNNEESKERIKARQTAKRAVKGEEYIKIYDRLRDEFLEQRKPIPDQNTIIQMVADEVGVSCQETRTCMNNAYTARKNKIDLQGDSK